MHPKSTPTPPNPSGLCQCGCGQPAPIAKQTSRRKGWVRGHPKRYIAAHIRRINDVPPDPNPSGLCMCGCGEPVGVFNGTARKAGAYKGHHKKYIAGHQTRKSPVPYIIEDRGYKTPCWIWQRSCNVRHGYGELRVDNKHYRAHKWYYEQKFGPVPDGMDLDHLCRQRACVNPDHLEPVTRTINAQRGARAKLTPEAVREIRRSANEVPSRVLADRYGVCYQVIRDVIRRKTWKNID